MRERACAEVICNHIFVEFLLEEQGYSGLCDDDKPSLFGSLHWASFPGVDEIIAGLVAVEGCNINGEGCAYSTPLVVKMLLGWEDIVME